MIMIVKV